MGDVTSREPLAIRAAVVAAVIVLIDVAVSFGWNLTMEQYASLTTAVGLIGTAVIVVWSRGKVTPVADPNLPFVADPDELSTVEDPDLVWPDEPVDESLPDAVSELGDDPDIQAD